MLAATASNASRTLTACGPWSWSTTATCVPTILPPNALPMMISWRIGSINDMIISVGERKNLRISRSMMANILFMAALPAAAAS